LLKPMAWREASAPSQSKPVRSFFARPVERMAFDAAL